VSKLELVAEIAKDAEEITGMIDVMLDAVGDSNPLFRKFFGVMMGVIDGIHIAALEHEGYHENFAKSRFKMFDELRKAGFDDDQALLLMVDNDLKMTKMKDTMKSITDKAREGKSEDSKGSSPQNL
jgi:hypothetical protein